jgi:lysophospholipase L1-like esterase
MTIVVRRSVWTAMLCLLAALKAGAQVADPNPARFAGEIRAFAEADAKAMPATGAVVFVGSSSIRLWPMAERFPGKTVINRGFGGSHMSDVNHFVTETVAKYAARAVVLYAGDNDIAAGKPPAQVLRDYRTFVEKVRSAQPDVDIYFIAIKPSLARWTLWPSAAAANDLIRVYSSTQPRLHYIDVVPPMLGADGKPRPDLFIEDGLHMTPAGYDIWTRLVGGAVFRN